MTRYTVNATISMAAWIDVEAEDEIEALVAAKMSPASSYDYDTGTAEIELNVEPAVEVAR